MKKVVLAVMCLSLSAVASAEGLGVSANVSTLGLGLDLTKGFSESVSGRLGFDTYTYNRSLSKSGVDYDGSLKWQSVHALADWYPSDNGFRVSGGLFYDNNKGTLTGKPSGGTYTINGTVYNATDVGSLNGDLSFNKAAPYIGIGWGNPVAKGKSWGFVADLGVLYQGTPSVSLNATCGAAIVGTATCTSLQNDTAAQQDKTRSDWSSYKWYPVASVGVSYQF
ncbi:MAG: hypothetical protein ACYDDT_13785 [Sulfuricella sp.]